MKVLVLGKGGREHTLAWKLAQSPKVTKVFCAPGNAGTSFEGENVPLDPDNIDDPNFEQLTDFARKNDIGLTIVGPELPLVRGVVDAFQAQNLLVFGPSKAAAQLEGSKVFCKDLLRHASIPTGEYQVFHTADEAEAYLNSRDDIPIVVKADGLAAGKGAIVCKNRSGALDAVDRIMRKRSFGAAGDRVIIEEKLEGEELSILAITDGRTIVTLEAAQDHKAAHDGDSGPNTGGMGAYCPAPLATPELIKQVEEEILVPTVHALKRGRTPFRGVLYAGLMMTRQGPKVLEYNVRFGDPEAQPVLMRLKTDLFELLYAAASGKLDELEPLVWDPRPTVCVVMASEGYPDSYPKGRDILGLDEAAQIRDAKVFHAGTRRDGSTIVTDGGRVLGITAVGDSITDAKQRAYELAAMVSFRGGWCRSDISDKAIAHTS